MRAERFALSLAFLASASAFCLLDQSNQAWAGPTFSIGTQESSKYVQAELVTHPEPEISADLIEHGVKCFCIARFSIEPTGKSTVKIVTSSGNCEADDIALRTLQRWKFKPATIDGTPVASSRKIKVEFEVN